MSNTVTLSKELHNIIVKGYSVALSKAFSNGEMYATGFLDGMKYQKDGTVPISAIDKEIEKLKEEGKW